MHLRVKMAPTLITTDTLVRCLRYLKVIYFLFSSTFLWVCLGTPNCFAIARPIYCEFTGVYINAAY